MTMFQRFKTCYYYNTLNNGSSCPFLCPSIYRKLLTKTVTAPTAQVKAVYSSTTTKKNRRNAYLCNAHGKERKASLFICATATHDRIFNATDISSRFPMVLLSLYQRRREPGLRSSTDK